MTLLQSESMKILWAKIKKTIPYFVDWSEVDTHLFADELVLLVQDSFLTPQEAINRFQGEANTRDFWPFMNIVREFARRLPREAGSLEVLRISSPGVLALRKED